MQAIKNYFKDLNKEEIYALIFAAGIFLPYVLSGMLLAFMFSRSLLVKDLREKIVKSSDFKFVLIFFALNLLSPIIHKNFLGLACFVGVNAILIVMLYLRSVMNDKLIQKCFDVMAFMSMTSAIVAHLQISDEVERAPSVFFNPNYYGAVITLVVLICFHRILKKQSNLPFMLITILVNLYGLLKADCQSAFFCIVFGVWLMLLFNKKYALFAITSVIGILMVVFLPKLTFIMPRISGFVHNLSLRADIWKIGIEAFKEDILFGRGMMGYFQVYKEYGGRKNFHCHNIVIDMLLSFGVIGGVPLVWFVVKNIAKAKGKKYAPLIFSVLGAVLLHSMVDVTIAWIQTGMLAALILSCVFVEGGRDEAHG